MKKLFLLYNNSRLKTKFIIMFVLSSILPIALLTGISAKVYESELVEKVNQMAYENLTQIAERANMKLEIYTNLLYQMNQDDQMIDDIKTLIDGDRGSVVAYSQINRRLKQYKSMEDGIRCIAVICANGEKVLYDTQTDSAVNYLWKNYSDLRMTPPYLDAAGKNGMIVTSTMTFQQNNQYSHYLHISKRIFDLNNLERGSIATIVVSVDENIINEICNPAEQGENNDFNFIVAADSTVISYPDEAFSGVRIGSEKTVKEYVNGSGLLGNQETELNFYEDKKTGWVFYNVYNKADLLGDVRYVQVILLFIGIVVLSLALLFAELFARQLNSSMEQVVDGMQKVQSGQLDVVLPVKTRDEVGMIAAHFNIMTEKLNLLIENVKEVSARQKNAEIHALEAQINPHFLYNTLDSINWMAIEKGEYEISKMLRDLGIILRYSISRSNEKAKITDIVNWMEKYVGLQQMRFEHVFEYKISVEEGTENCRIYKLLLQPFLENAILHGFKEIEGGGILRVDIMFSEDKDSLLVTIEDNGRGMPKEMTALYNDMEKAIKEGDNSIGLHNAFSRMNIYYGDRASWKITSIPEIGTVIMLRLPVEWDENHENIDRGR